LRCTWRRGKRKLPSAADDRLPFRVVLDCQRPRKAHKPWQTQALWPLLETCRSCCAAVQGFSAMLVRPTPSLQALAKQGDSDLVRQLIGSPVDLEETDVRCAQMHATSDRAIAASRKFSSQA
jgi:hypothetical protein